MTHLQVRHGHAVWLVAVDFLKPGWQNVLEETFLSYKPAWVIKGEVRRGSGHQSKQRGVLPSKEAARSC